MDQHNDIDMPDVLDVSPEAVSTADANLDPAVRPPANARADKNKKNNEMYYRWAELLTIEQMVRSTSPESKLVTFLIRARVKPNGQPGNKNVGKSIWTRYRVNFRVLNGQEENAGHTYMNDLSMKGLVSLLKATGRLPDNHETEGLKAALLMHLFPRESDGTQSELVGTTLIGNCLDRPNKGGKRDRDTEVETWLPRPADPEE